MSTPSDFHFYEDTFARLDAALTGYVGDVASNVIGAFTGVTYTLLMIYMMLWGWSTLRGMISEPVTDAMTRLIRLSVIVGIAMEIGRYNTFVSDFLWSTPDALAAIVADGYSDSTSNVQFLDELMSKLYDLGDAYWQKANAMGDFFPDFGLLATAVLIWIAGVAATAYGAFLLALSKMALAILLGVGPLFVLCLIFEGTKRFFESWLGQALNYVFLVVLTAGAIKLILTILEAYLTVAGTPVDPTIDQALPAIVLCVIAALVMTQLPSIASALGGGAAVSTLGAVGWAYGKAKGGVVAMRPTNLKRSYNKASSDVRIARGAAGAVAGAPAAVYRRITGGAKNRVSQA
jgi:type IV secretion system protein VirB6